MLVLLVLVGLGWLGWRLTRHTFSFPGRFAALLSESSLRQGVVNLFTGRARVNGRFLDRLVTLFYQRASEHRTGHLVISMPVAAPDESMIQVRSGSDTAESDRELERALFALEGRHELRVIVKGGWLHATWMPMGLFIFPGRFDPAKWRDVLEHLRVVASRLEVQPRATLSPVPSPTAVTYASEPWPVRRRRGPFVLTAIASLVLFTGASMLVVSVPLVAASNQFNGLTRTTAVFAGILFVTGALTLLALARSSSLLINEREPSADAARTPFGGWLWGLLVTLLVLPAWMVVRVAPLVPLWQDMLGFLDEHDVWSAAEAAQEFSGVVLLPVFAVLALPALEAAVACSLVIGVIVLVPLLVTASPAFPRSFLGFVLLMAGLAISAQVATGATLEAGRLLESALRPGPEAEAVRVASARYILVLQRAASGLLLVAVSFALWTPLLFTSERVQTTFAEPSVHDANQR
jgi:hypothetical protein